MKRSLLLILSLLVSIFAWGMDFPIRPTVDNNRFRTEEQLASYVYSLADTLTYELQDKYQADYTYQANKIEMVLVKELFENGWLEIEKYLYQYANDKITEELYQIYNDGWVNYQKQSYFYDEEGLLTDYQLDDWSDNAWSPNLHIDYTYNSERVLVNEEWTYYTNREVDYLYNATYQYDDQGRVNQETWTSSTDGINWTNYLKGIYTFNDNNSIIHEDWQYWYEPSWISYLQYNHTYNSFNKIEYTEGLSFYDDQWQLYDNYSYLYNDNQNVSLLVAKLWSAEEDDWVNSYKYTYTYQEIVSIDDNDVIANNFHVDVYPNPFNDKVRYDSKQQISKVSIYNLKGQKIFSSLLKGKKGSLSNLDKHPSGIYFFKFEDEIGNDTVTKILKINK